MKRLLPVIMLALSSCCIVPKSHIAAERAVYEALRPDFEAYLEADESLLPHQKDLKMRTFEHWDEMLRRFEEKMEAKR